MKKSFVTQIFMLFATCFLAFGVQAQMHESSCKALSDEDFSKAKELYLKMYNSQSYQKMTELSKTLAEKMGFVEDFEILQNDDKFESWISSNIQKTKFKSVEEAVLLRKNGIEWQDKVNTENSEIFKLLAIASKEQKKEILKLRRSSL